MILHELEYEGFRNLVNGHLEFAEGFNLIQGPNGAGKSNLLEAIFFSAYATSFRTNEDRNLVKFNDSYLRVKARSNRTEASVFYNGEKKLILGGNQKQRLSEFVGWLQVTVLCLDDIWIIRGAPAKRRLFLDWLLSKLSPEYVANLANYKKILRQRNHLLQIRKTDTEDDLLDVFDERLIYYGNRVYEARERILPELQKKFIEFVDYVGLINPKIDYISSCPDMRLNGKLLRDKFADEIKWGETLIGPHRDDLLLTLNGSPVKNFASEGELRLCAVGLKIAEAKILQNKTGETPILLIDEIAGELDENRKSQLFGMFGNQIFYATTQDIEQLNKFVTRKFSISGGRVEVS